VLHPDRIAAHIASATPCRGRGKGKTPTRRWAEAVAGGVCLAALILVLVFGAGFIGGPHG
jgi:hypothetical protein